MARKNQPGRPSTIKPGSGIDTMDLKQYNKLVFGDKIRAARKERGLTQPQLSAAIGVTKNAVTNWELGFTRPEISYIARLCEVLKISADTFFGIPNRGTALEKHEWEHIQLYRELNRYDQSSVDALIKVMLENEEKAFRDECKERCRRLPLIELAYSAGTGNPLDDTYEQEDIYLHNDRNVAKADAIVTVSGDSMEPTFYDGDNLLVKRVAAVDPGEIGIFVVAGEGFVKEFQLDGLHSHNDKYETIRPTEDDNVHCLGRVLGTVTKDMYVTRREAEALDEIYSQAEEERYHT